MRRYPIFLAALFANVGLLANSPDTLKPYEGLWTGRCHHVHNGGSAVDDVRVEVKELPSKPNEYILKLKAKETASTFPPTFLKWNPNAKKWEARDNAATLGIDSAALILTLTYPWGSLSLSKLGVRDPNKAIFSLLFNIAGPWQQATLCEVTTN